MGTEVCRFLVLNTNNGKRTMEPQVLSIPEFCEAYRTSRSSLYRLWRAGLGPAKMRVFGRVTISVPSADTWRRDVEKASNPGPESDVSRGEAT